jgi:hypothetical protein
MSQEIKIDFNISEQLVDLHDKIATLAGENTAELSKAEASLTAYFMQGSFRQKFVGNNQNGIGKYAQKAQDFTTLAEVTKQYVAVAGETFVDLDKMLAVKIINLGLANGDIGKEGQDAIRENPNGVVDVIKDAIKK